MGRGPKLRADSLLTIDLILVAMQQGASLPSNRRGARFRGEDFAVLLQGPVEDTRPSGLADEASAISDPTPGYDFRHFPRLRSEPFGVSRTLAARRPLPATSPSSLGRGHAVRIAQAYTDTLARGGRALGKAPCAWEAALCASPCPQTGCWAAAVRGLAGLPPPARMLTSYSRSSSFCLV